MLPKSVRVVTLTMLKLPQNWRRCCGGYVIEDLLIQAEKAGHYSEAARAMAKAAIDFMLAGPRWNKHQPPPALVPLPTGWRLNDWIFHVLRTTNDDALKEMNDLPKRLYIDVLAPPWSRDLITHAVRSAYPARHLSVTTVDAFCDTRLLLTGMDMGEVHSNCVHNFLERYRRIAHGNPAIRIRIPKSN
jgi:hypothetical protein